MSTEQQVAVIDQSSRGEIIEHLPFTTDAGVGPRARIGLVVLRTDYTVEHEFRRILALVPGVDVFHARIKNSTTITPQSLAAMGPLITETAHLILTPGDVQVMAYGCTSASMVLGEDHVTARIHAAHPDVAATNPITAAFAALRTLGTKRIAVLTPYRRDVNEVVRACFCDAGFEVPVFGSFNQENDTTVAAIDAESLRRAIRTITSGRDVDAVFVSCTSVRLVAAVQSLEAEFGLPVTSSNHALAWHCLRLAGIDDKLSGLGRLFEMGIKGSPL